MASYTYEQLRHMTVSQLRQIAHDLENKALDGYTTMHKEQLLPVLCNVLGIQTHHLAAGIEKSRLKGLIRKLKAKRDAATASGDRAQLARARRQIHVLKHRLRRMADLSV
jgi:ABC-type Fe3+-citrate transport system substrate-binding protein